MSRTLSVYLDLIRGLAAVVVLLSHLGHGHLIGGPLWIFTYIGNEAVLAFFVLSGFVIAYVSDTREVTLKQFSAARVARLYSVIIPAMALTAFLDGVGYSVDPQAYTRTGAINPDQNPYAGYLYGFLMINQSWSLESTFGSNGPYWSIPYEFWYYFLFAAATYLRGWKRLVASAFGVIVAGPAIMSLLPVWMLGVVGYRLVGFLREPRRWLAAMFFASAGAIVAMLYADWSSMGSGDFIGVVPGTLEWKYMFGVLVLANMVSFLSVPSIFHATIMAGKKHIRLLSSLTFSLYLFHAPLLHFLAAVSPFPASSPWHHLSLLIMPFLLAYTLGMWCERQKATVFRLITSDVRPASSVQNP